MVTRKDLPAPDALHKRKSHPGRSAQVGVQVGEGGKGDKAMSMPVLDAHTLCKRGVWAERRESAWACRPRVILISGQLLLKEVVRIQIVIGERLLGCQGRNTLKALGEKPLFSDKVEKREESLSNKSALLYVRVHCILPFILVC